MIPIGEANPEPEKVSKCSDAKKCNCSIPPLSEKVDKTCLFIESNGELLRLPIPSSQERMLDSHAISVVSTVKENQLPQLFNSARPSEFFGITKHIMDKFNHLPRLINEAKVHHISGNEYEIKSTISMPGQPACSLGLEYDFIANSQEEAEGVFERFKEVMRGETLKVWLAFWKMANIKRKFQYGASLTEIMSQGAAEDREFYFSIKEKKSFWMNAKLLSRTKLNIVCDIKFKGQKRVQRLQISHRMLEITAKISDIDGNDRTEDVYPNELVVRVLDPDHLKEKSCIATRIANSTCRLPVSEVLMALSLQIRGSQRQGKPPMAWNEDDLMRLANLEKTAGQNKSVARGRLEGKIKKLQHLKIVSSSKREGEIFHIQTENQKKTG